MPDLEWYYVSHVIPDDIPNQTMPFEVQVLGKHGEAEAVGYIDVTYDSLAINGKSIPSAVIEAVKRYPLGFGDYVDSAGKRLDLWGNPLPGQPETDRETLASILVETAVRLITMPSPCRRRAIARLRAVVTSYGETHAAQRAQSMLNSLG
jgi:hypothetical protein